MNLHRILKISKGIPPENLHDMLFVRKNMKNNTLTSTVSGYPCILENSVVGNVRKYRIYGNGNGVGNLTAEGEYSGKYCIPVVCGGKNLFDKNASYTISVTTYNYTIGNLDPEKYYTCSTNFQKTVLTASVYFGGGQSNLNGVWSGESKTFKPNINGEISVYIRYKEADDATPVIDDILNGSITVMVEEGSTATEYESYQTPVTTNIYLHKPLETGDILKYPENITEHADGTSEKVILPEVPTFEGTTVISTDTEIKPSDIKITYKVRK